jgi:DNA-binding MarR family transcriptional regulator
VVENPARELLKADYERLAALRYQLRRFLRFSERAAQAVGLTPRQYQALLAIAGCPDREGLPVGALAEQLLVAPHSAVGLVDRLCAQGVLERRPGPADRRQVLVGLTARGRARLDGLAHAHQAELRRLGPTLQALLEALAGATAPLASERAPRPRIARGRAGPGALAP